MADRLTVLASDQDYRRGNRVLIAMVNDHDEIVGIVPQFTIEKYEDNPRQLGPAPTLDGRLGAEFLQSALDAAWGMGMRPKNWRVETTEQVAAMNAHLQDMRALVFEKAAPELNVAEPRARV